MGGEVAQRGCGSLIPGGVQDPVGQGPGLPGLVGGIPVCGRRVGTKLSLRSFPTQASLLFLRFMHWDKIRITLL